MTRPSVIVLLTNHIDFGATTISAIYRDRWKIELFFKALKQNLKVKTFVGTTENALRIQIWTALLAILILKWLHHLSRAGWSLSTLASWTAGRRMKGNLLRAFPVSGLFKLLNIAPRLAIPAVLGQQ